MPTIEQYRVPVKVSGGTAYHYSWVMKDEKGNEMGRFDGWPTNPDGTAYIEGTGFGKPLKVLTDTQMRGEPKLMGRYSGSAEEIDRRWKAGESAMEAINADPPSYRPMDHSDIMGDKETIPATNSNSVHATIGKAMGFDTSDQVGGHAPGMNRQLLPDTFAPPGEKLPPARLTSPDQHSGLTPEKAAEQNMTAGQYLVARQQERDARNDAGIATPLSQGTQLADARNPDVKTDWVEPTGQAKPGGNLLDTAPQTGGLANEAAETQAAADQVKADGAREQTANIDSRIQSMREMAAQPIDHPGKSALLKPVGVWTESEMKDVLNSAQGDFTGWQSGDPLKARMYETVQDWHSNTYGDGPQVVDGGKPMEPSPIKPLNIVAMPHATPQGEDLWKASARMGDKIGTIAENDGYEASVKAMQRGLNMLNDSAGQPERSPAWGDYTPQEALKVDGEYGPKTDFALKDTLARHGETKADDALALGRFGTFADQVRQTGKADGLDQAARDIFGPLYGGSEAPNGVLQETLNKVGGDNIDNWQDLKVDDWIGPKTTDAFAQVMDQTDPEDFTRSFGQGLGLL